MQIGLKNIPTEEKGGGDWMTLPPSASSSPAPSSAAGQVAGGRPTSADFSPFSLPLSCSFISCSGIVHSPLAPRRSISWGSSVLPVTALSLPSYTSILPDIERSAVGHSHLRRANNGLFKFFLGVIWALSSVIRGGFVL